MLLREDFVKAFSSTEGDGFKLFARELQGSPYTAGAAEIGKREESRRVSWLFGCIRQKKCVFLLWMVIFLWAKKNWCSFLTKNGIE